MESDVIGIDGNVVGKIKVPEIFENVEIKKDLLKKAFLADLSKTFQLHYPDPLAGTKKSVDWRKRRFGKHGFKWKTIYRGDRSRTPSKVMAHQGNGIWVYEGAFVPQAVGGREAHPPSPNKKIEKKINKKEKKKAILMAIAASMKPEYVSKYHKIESVKIPIVLDDSAESIAKTKQIKELLNKIGLEGELKRISKVKISSTKGKYRGRRYKKKAPLIIVTSNINSNLQESAKNLNIKVVPVGHLSMLDVTHAGEPGRLIIWTKTALEKIPLWLK